MSQKSGRLLLIDGHSMAYRAFFALPVDGFKTSTGQPTNAIYGFAAMLINIIQEEKPTHLAVAFDVSRKTFRTERFPEYKANRESTPDEFRSQISHITEVIDAFGIRHIELSGFEADDIIATLTKQAELADLEVLICTGDRDSFQLINTNTTVLYPKKGVTEMARMTPAALIEKYSLTPEQYADFAALRGDPSDNLPSIPGVGEKTATKWLVEYKNLKGVISNASAIAGKVGEALRMNIDQILLNRELTQLVSNLQLPISLDELAWPGVEISRVLNAFESLEIKALRERVKSLPQIGGAVVEEISVEVTEITADQLSQKLLKHQSPIGIAIEVENEIIKSYAVAVGSNQVYSIMESKVGPWITDESIGKIVHNAKYLIKSHGMKGLRSDIELIAYLLNPGSRNLSVTDLAESILGVNTSSDTLFSNFNPKIAAWIFQLETHLKTDLAKLKMNSLYEGVEQPTLLLLSKMESVGVAVDEEKLAKLQHDFSTIVTSEIESAHKVVGHEFNINSPKQLQVILFEELKLPKTKKIKTGYTTDAESLEWLYLKSKHPLLKHLLRTREVTKLLSTIEGLIASISKDGRIHTTFQQTVAATGRLSSTEPNLQNIPIRTDEGRKIRDCFIAQDPYTHLLTADYSQIEMRIMAHLSNDRGLIAAFESGEDLHSTVAAQVFSVSADKVDAEMRRTIKAMSYGLAYGLSSFGLSQQLDIDPTEASTLMNKYFERFGGIQNYLKSIVAIAKQKGYTETILGRRRYLPDLNNENRQRREIAERAALNAPIQGSAADIIKLAMLKVEKDLQAQKFKSRLLLQVHDELIFEVSPEENDSLSSLVKNAMSSAYKLKVPLDVNIGMGKSWDLAAH